MTRPRPLTVVTVVAVAGLIGVLGWGLLSKAPAGSLDSALAAGERPAAPALELPRLGARSTARLADWHGRVVVLNFWASWCGPCRDESPMLERWHRRLARQGGTVLGVNVEDVTSDARAFIRRYRLTYPMLRDGDGSSAEPFEVLGYPETVVIDRRGRIAAALRGPVDETFMRDKVQPLLTEAA